MLMYSSTAHTASWKNDDTVQSVLFSWGSGDIFQRGIHHAVTIKKLKEQKTPQTESPFFSLDDGLQSLALGEELPVNTDFSGFVKNRNWSDIPL